MEVLLLMDLGITFQSLGPSTLISLNPQKLVLALRINKLLDLVILLMSVILDLVLYE